MFSAAPFPPCSERCDGGVARLDHLFERAALVRRVALHRLDQIGDQVMPQLELHIDVGKRLVDPLPHGNEAVVDRHRPDRDHDDHAEDGVPAVVDVAAGA